MIIKVMAGRRDEEKAPQPDHGLRKQTTMEKLLEISDRCAQRPVLDPRSPDEIIGYDEHGVPT